MKRDVAYRLLSESQLFVEPVFNRLLAVVVDRAVESADFAVGRDDEACLLRPPQHDGARSVEGLCCAALRTLCRDPLRD